ncbi:MAG: TPM domain-containing protein, partial [Microthrixaceae bacterium]
MHRRAVAPAGVVAAGVIAVVLAVGALWAVPAGAEGPITFEGADQLQDPAGLLGDRADEVGDALERLRTEDGVQLFVVVVEELDGTGAQDWADRTATINGLGVDDALLVVATEDRQYAWSVDQDFPLSDEQLRDAARESIEPQLREGDWAGAAIGAADSYRERLGAADGSGSTDGGGSSSAAANGDGAGDAGQGDT